MRKAVVYYAAFLAGILTETDGGPHLRIQRKVCGGTSQSGKSYRQSVRMMQTIRKKLRKLEYELVSIEEFCQYTSLKIEQVEPLIVE